MPDQDSVDAEAGRARKVLVIDDHDALRDSMVRLFTAWGHIVEGAGDGSAALSVARQFQPDFVILDLSLRDITGFDLARRLRAGSRPPQPYLVALTAFADQGMRDACLGGGFDAYLIKPEGIAELEELLRR